MKLRTLLLPLLLLTFLTPLSAQDGEIEFRPVSCLLGGELPVLQVSLKNSGELRAYFRHVNTTDWCSVEGVNRGPLSSVTLPKFENGDEIEYFFLLLDGKRVVAKSPQIYRVKVAETCDTAFARHNVMITMDCGNRGPGSMPASMGAGYALKSTAKEPLTPSPDTTNATGRH